MKSNPVEFMPPAGVVPETTSPGDEFDLVTTYRLKPDGKVCLVKAGDVDMPGYGDKDKGMAKAPDYSNMAEGMRSAMASGMGEQS